MDRRKLAHYLVRLSNGESSLSESICQALSSQLVFVALKTDLGGSNSHSGYIAQDAMHTKEVVSRPDTLNSAAPEFISLSIAGRQRGSCFEIPVFSSKIYLDRWCELAFHNQRESAALLAGDLCLALSAMSPELPPTLHLDPGASHSCKFDLDQIRQMAQSGCSDLPRPKRLADFTRRRAISEERCVGPTSSLIDRFYTAISGTLRRCL